MVKVSIVFHSESGSTEEIAKSIMHGLKNAGADVYMAPCTENIDLAKLNESDAIIFGCPTYYGSVSGQMKIFMDKLFDIWNGQLWKNKIAAAFTDSAALNGDKLNVLMQFTLFAMQHSMIWVGLETIAREERKKMPFLYNRMGSWLGLMSQTEDTGITKIAPESDHQTAEMFGARIADICNKFKGRG